MICFLENLNDIIGQAKLKPQFIKSNEDNLIIADVKFLESLLSSYEFTAEAIKEQDGSFTQYL